MQGAKIRTTLAAVAYVLAVYNAINYANVNEALKMLHYNNKNTYYIYKDIYLGVNIFFSTFYIYIYKIFTLS